MSFFTTEIGCHTLTRGGKGAIGLYLYQGGGEGVIEKNIAESPHYAVPCATEEFCYNRNGLLHLYHLPGKGVTQISKILKILMILARSRLGSDVSGQ